MKRIVIGIAILIFTIWWSVPLVKLLLQVRQNNIEKREAREWIEFVCEHEVRMSLEPIEKCIEARTP